MIDRRKVPILVFSALALGAAGSTGTIKGQVTDEATGDPLPGVTVSVIGPQGEATEFTDASGQYRVTQLVPGEYVVRFYYSDLVVERSQVILEADETLALNVAMASSKAKASTYTSTQSAPTVDVGNTQIQTALTKDVLAQIPIRGQTIQDALTLAPGSAVESIGPQGNAGISFNGATSPENAYLIDGHAATGVAFGLLGTPLSLHFLEEAEIITAGYNAEYGRALGGIVNVVTKSGSNELMGSTWLSWQPFELDSRPIARLGEAVVSQRKPGNTQLDFGAEVGGPVWKDHIFFYGGLEPIIVKDSYVRSLRARTFDGQLVDLSGRSQSFSSTSKLLSMIGKIDVLPNDDHRLTLTYIGNPSSFDGVFANPRDPNSLGIGFNADPAVLPYKETIQTHDLSARLTSKFFGRALEVEAAGAFHREIYKYQPNASAQGQVVVDQTSPLSAFENVPECAPMMVQGAVFNPCPVTNYQYGGFGYYHNSITDRASGILGLTYYLELFGTHAIKVGGDMESLRYDSDNGYTGGESGGRFDILPDGTVQRVQFATLDPATQTVQLLPNGFRAVTTTFNRSLYVRDSYSLGFLPGATVNYGVRWESQRLRDIEGNTRIDIEDNFAPRVGFIYDWTQKGLSKVYASYARYYESIPLDLNDRAFTKSGVAVQSVPGSACKTDANGRVDPSTCNFGAPNPSALSGGTYAVVSPVLKGMYNDEVVAGLQSDVGWNMVLGAGVLHRTLGRIIEDMSPDGGAHFILGNPGDKPDPQVTQRLQNDISNLDSQIAAATDPAKKAALMQQKSDKVTQLSLYQGIANFPSPERDYNAVILTANKRFGKNLTLLASYVFSRTEGNYPGLYQASNMQLNPHTSSQWDLFDLTMNRNGPLPNDRPHNLKIAGAYFFNLGDGERDGLTVGLAFNLISGVPIDVLGRHPFYGASEVYILPRGAGGRTPTVTSLDLQLAYTIDLGSSYRLDIIGNVFNVLDERTALSVDNNYTYDVVAPIANGTMADLATLKTTSGQKPVLNPNYGQPTAYQPPLAARIGAKLSF